MYTDDKLRAITGAEQVLFWYNWYTFLTCRWEELISLTKQRKQLLKGAEQVHKFVRDASDTNDRMNEKVHKRY